jgi:FtsH-binding integral membrane protein
MDVDRESAAASLSDVELAERRTFKAVVYGRSGSILILWGMATAAGYVATQYRPAWADYIWPIVWCAGFGGMFVLLGRGRRSLDGSHRALQWRLVTAQAALLVFGLLTTWLLAPLDGRQLNAFWPLLFMLGYVLAGLWVGPFFILCGIGVAALTVAGYWLSGSWFPLWMAAVNGGALIIGGLWLRRAGVHP